MYVDYELQTQIIEGLDLGIIFFTHIHLKCEKLLDCHQNNKILLSSSVVCDPLY